MATLEKNILAKVDIEIKESSFSEAIYKAYKESGKKEIVFINIGTDRVTGDSFGPLVGHLLEDYLLGVYSYGTLDNPIHAKNLSEKLEEIYETHKDALFISVDASLGSEGKIGNVYLKNKPLIPGEALGKDLPSVGDYSITGVVNTSGNLEFIILQNTRLSMVMNLAKQTVAEILKLDQILKLENSRLNVI